MLAGAVRRRCRRLAGTPRAEPGSPRGRRRTALDRGRGVGGGSSPPREVGLAARSGVGHGRLRRYSCSASAARFTGVKRRALEDPFLIRRATCFSFVARSWSLRLIRASHSPPDPLIVDRAKGQGTQRAKCKSDDSDPSGSGPAPLRWQRRTVDHSGRDVDQLAVVARKRASPARAPETPALDDARASESPTRPRPLRQGETKAQPRARVTPVRRPRRACGARGPRRLLAHPERKRGGGSRRVSLLSGRWSGGSTALWGSWVAAVPAHWCSRKRSPRRRKNSARVMTPSTRPESTTGITSTRWWRNVSASWASEKSLPTSMCSVCM